MRVYGIVKLAALVVPPAGVVTSIFPVVAPRGTVVVILAAEFTTCPGAGVPLNVTLVAPVKFAPLMVTLAPTPPWAGVKLVIRGATVKLVALVTVPAGVVTLSVPLVALAGTVALICVPELDWIAASNPLSLTEVAPVRAVPVIVTVAPTAPLLGVKLAMVGLTVKFPVLVAGPPAGVVTAIFPVVAPPGTVAVILIDVVTVKVAAVPLNVTVDTPGEVGAIDRHAGPDHPAGRRKARDPRRHGEVGRARGRAAGRRDGDRPGRGVAGTVIVICVPELTVKGAVRPLSLTDVAPVKFVPMMATLSADRAATGENPLIVGVRRTVKLVALVTVPAAVVTAMGPVVAPGGHGRRDLDRRIGGEGRRHRLNVTDDAPAKLAPLMVTLAPVAPVDGVKLVIRGATTKLVALVAVPAGASSR